MKILRLTGVGIVIWGLSMLWPQINQVLTSSVMMGITLGLGVGTVAYLLIQRLDYKDQANGTVDQDCSSRPFPITAAR